MKENPAYTRRISSEEAREGYVMVVKSKLSYFPPLGKTFELVQNGRRSKARVQSYQCTCRGPESAHEHYFFVWKGLRRGDKIEVRENVKKSGEYIARVHG